MDKIYLNWCRVCQPKIKLESENMIPFLSRLSLSPFPILSQYSCGTSTLSSLKKAYSEAKGCSFL